MPDITPISPSIDLNHCMLCPRKCGVNRLSGERGVCAMGSDAVAARAALHYWEEPCISGQQGSGTVFFSGCGLQCCFCQNDAIRKGQVGQAVSTGKLSQIFLDLQDKGAHNINLVTPTHFIPQITQALKDAKKHGLTIPIICNSSGYENVETLKIWDGLIDIYLTDMKFCSPSVSEKMCGARDYFEQACLALAEMYRQIGSPSMGEDGLMQKGIIVRHLMLPGYLFDSRRVLEYLCTTYHNHIYISLMNQYTPPSGRQSQASNPPDHPLREDHYEAMIRYLQDQGIENAYTQEAGTCLESFIPAFDLTGITETL